MSAPMTSFEPLGEIVAGNPKHATIESTDRCNTRCLHCAHYHTTFGVDMAESVVRKAVDALVDGAESITASGGGEPLIAEACFSILEACEARNVPVSFVTNAILLRDEALVRRLVRAEAGITVSIDGARPETFGFVRPALSWEGLLEALALVRRCAREAGPACRSSLGFLCVAMKDTLGDLPDLVRMASEYGALYVVVQSLSGDNGLDKLRGQSPHDAPEVVIPACLEAMAVAHDLGVSLSLPPSYLSMIRKWAADGRADWQGDLSKGARRVLEDLLAQRASAPEACQPGPKTGIRPCRQPWECTFVSSSGIVRACCMGGATLGDLNTQEWNEIWNGALYRSFRRTVHSWNPPGPCRTCLLPEGILGGDNMKYTRYFARFRDAPVALDGQEARIAEGFEAVAGGQQGAPIWRLHSGNGTLAFQMRQGARFLRLTIESTQSEPTPGVCTICDGPAEPFDTSCAQVHFPLDHVSAGSIDARFRMESGPGRGLGIAAADLLF